MGLIKAGMGAIGGVLADQWKEYFYCESLTPDVLMAKGQKRTSSRGRSSNTSAEDNIISNGSVIAVNNGQCMMIVEQGKVVELCAEPGEESVVDVFKRVGKRFTFGGDTGKDQRVYYFNTKEIIGNKYGTPSEVPFKTVDEGTGLKLTVRIRCFGEYSYKIVDPILFYTNVAGNAGDEYLRSQIDSQLKSELLTALQPAFAKISAMKIDYTELPGRTYELADALNSVLSAKWRELRGIEVVSFGVNSVKANEEDEAKIQKIQMGMAMSNPAMGAGVLVDAQADAMKIAAANEGGMGAAFGFMGMNMAGAAGGMNTGNLYGMAQQQQQQAPVQSAPPPAAPPAATRPPPPGRRAARPPACAYTKTRPRPGCGSCRGGSCTSAPAAAARNTPRRPAGCPPARAHGWCSDGGRCRGAWRGSARTAR